MSAPRLSQKTLAHLPRKGKIGIHDSGVSVWEPTVDAVAMASVWHELRAHFWRRGWKLREDPQSRMLKLRRGRKGQKGQELEVKLDVTGCHVEVTFFQNVANVENQNGGEYDFNKFARMPRDLRTRCLVEMVALVRWLEGLGYAHNADLARLSAASPLPLAIRTLAEGREQEGLTPLQVWERRWGENRVKRDASGWPPASGVAYLYKDRDGRTMKPGDRRWVYLTGRLVEVTVYPNENGMWMCWAGGSRIWTASSGELFTWDPARPPPRRKRLDAKALRERLGRELGCAVREQRWPRVAALGGALGRLDAASASAPTRRAA